jgi:hypothetical protein
LAQNFLQAIFPVLPPSVPISISLEDWANPAAFLAKCPPKPKALVDFMEGPCPIYPGKRAKETHIAVPLTKNFTRIIDGVTVTVPRTLKTLDEFDKASGELGCRTISKPILKPDVDKPSEIDFQWVVMTQDVLPESRNASCEDQDRLVSAKGYQMPGFLEVITCILWANRSLGIRLYSNSPLTYTRCYEKVQGSPVAVGGFSPLGLNVYDGCLPYDRDDVCVGVGGMRKFPIQEEKLAIGNGSSTSSAIERSISSSIRTEAQEIRNTFLGCLIGEAEWALHLGAVEKVPLPKGMLKILNQPCPVILGKKVGETHTLVLIPATVDGRPLTLNSLGALVKSKRYFLDTEAGYKYKNPRIATEHGDKPVGSSHWALMTKDVLPGSKDKSYTEQELMVASLERTPGSSYKVPKVLDATACLFMNYLVSSGTRLFNDSPGTYTRCQEELYGYRVIVGNFSTAGPSIRNVLDHNNDAYTGVAAQMEFYDTQT